MPKAQQQLAPIKVAIFRDSDYNIITLLRRAAQWLSVHNDFIIEDVTLHSNEFGSMLRIYGISREGNK